MLRPPIRQPTDLVLVGGGHTHIQVLKSFAMTPVEGVRLTVIVDTPIAVYSGMVPGFVAGQYAQDELEIDVLPLARLAGARLVRAAAIAVDPAARLVRLDCRPPIRYHLASFDIGSTVAGLEVPGVGRHALATRPIGRFVERLEAVIDELGATGPGGRIRLVVVGAGAGGVELAFTLEQRVRSLGLDPEVTLIEGGPRILAGQARGLGRRALLAAENRRIRVLTDQRVVEVERQAVTTESGSASAPPERRRHQFDILVWVTGATGRNVFRASDLPIDDRGFVRVRPTLQIEGQDRLFAVGDCAHLVEDPTTPKAGVYAVRQGPVLTENLRRALEGNQGLEPYRPQRDFLTLLNLGDGTALGAKWGISFAGAWVFRLKDAIDRRFMRKFQALDTHGTPERNFRELAGMRAEMDVLCGGCAAKLGQSPLERVLARLGPTSDPAVELGLEHSDDVASYRSPSGQRVVSSVDQFRAFTDDAYLVGRVGAVNAASDVLAKGVEAAYAQALVALPESESPAEREETLFQVLAGARDAFDELDVVLVGGHTTTASELLVGFLVEGFAGPEDRLLTLDGLETGDHLVLTKPLGTGVLFHADMKARLAGRWFEEALETMLRSNRAAARTARRYGAAAATDVTGFGLAGHLAGMLRASGVAATVRLDALPALAGAVELLGAGLRSTFHPENERAARGMAFDARSHRHPRYPLLFDPQTSGGLVFGVSEERVPALLEALAESDPAATVIGRVTEALAGEGPRLRVVAG